MTTASQARGRFIGCALIFAVTLAAYWPALRGGFIWDDDAHVTKVALRSWSGLGRIWFELGATQQYYPILHSAFWLEHRLWGDNPFCYHVLNVLLHATSACLVVVILRRISDDETRSADRGAERVSVSSALLAGLIFALHPVCVESVAWVSEQKNTLSTVFYLLAALTYLRSGRPAYWLATLLFILALLTKSVTATLPAALLVILWWKNGRLSWKRDIVPLLPWFALALGAGLLTAWVERTYIGAQGAHFALTFGSRVLLAGRITAFYLGKLLWPAGLIFVYPRWPVESWTLRQAVFPIGVISLIVIAWLARRRSRGPLAGLLFFAGSLLPALGFFNVYPFVFSYVADHFQYLASLGIFALAGWALARGWDAFSPARPAVVALLLLLGLLTWRQCRMYRDDRVLYETTLDRNPGAWLAHLNLGNLELARGRTREAVAHYEAAERLEPDYPSTHFNLAKAELNEGDPSAASREFQQALRIAPNDAEARNNLGIALAQLGRLSEAQGQFEAAIGLRPGYARAHGNLGSVLLDQGHAAEAAAQYEAAIRIEPGLAEPHCNLGLALLKLGRVAEARSQFEAALRIDPGYAPAREAKERLP